MFFYYHFSLVRARLTLPTGAAHPSIQKVVASKVGSSSGKSAFAAPAASDVVAVKNFQNCQVLYMP
jgi:hypothetical protein